MDNTISEVSKGKWLISVSRQYGDEKSTGEVVILQKSKPIEGDIQHVPLAGARARLALAQSMMEVDDFEGALSNAQAGLEELGHHDYVVALGVVDDTSLYIYMAEDLMEKGDIVEAARCLMPVLETRISLYTQLHADTIAE